MSVCIPLSSLNNSLIKKLNSDLIVKPISSSPITSKFNPKASSYSKGTSAAVECFDTCKVSIGNKLEECAIIPYSYYYHNLSFIQPFNLKKDINTSISANFEGDLLKRQKDVREETFEVINRTNTVVLSLHTGFGKTIFALYILSKIKLRTIVLCHRKIIMEQWIESIKKYLPNTTVSILGIKKENPNADIMIANVINIPKKSREYFFKYDCVIIDEIHTVCTESFSKSLLYIFPKYVIGLSATPFRTDGMDRIIELFCGPEIIYRKLYIPFNVYKVNTNFKPDTRLSANSNLDWNFILEQQAEDTERNRLIVNLCKFLSTRVILVMVKRKDHATILHKMLKDLNEDVDIFIGTQNYCNYESRILISTTSKSGVGFSHNKVNTLISAADVEENFTQYIGRIFRKDDVSALYIDLIDQMSTIKKHSTTRLKICREIGGVVKDFDKSFPNFHSFVKYLQN